MAAALPGRQVTRYVERTSLADGDQPILSHEPRRLLVQMTSSGMAILAWIALTRFLLRARCALPSARSYLR